MAFERVELPMDKSTDRSVQTVPDEPPESFKWFDFEKFPLKNLLDILLLLLISIMIGILTLVLQKNDSYLHKKNRQNDLDISQKQRDNDEHQALALGNETVFNQYITNMAKITLNSQGQSGNQQITVTRALTLTVFRQLDLEKKKLAVRFLHDTDILRRGKSPFQTVRNVQEMHLKDADLDRVDFSGGLKLPDLVLQKVSLVNASFANSDLRNSDFSGSILTGVNFNGTILDGAKFTNAQLQRTNFHGASVRNIQLTQANLVQSSITNDQIAQALLVYNTISPNGAYARNKTFLFNGDAKQGTLGWNVTSGVIHIQNSYFTGEKNSSMTQRINASEPVDYSRRESIHYCLSLEFHGQRNLMVKLAHFDSNLKLNNDRNITKILSSSSDDILEHSTGFSSWFYCDSTPTETRYIDLQFIFGVHDDTIAGTNFAAVKDVQFTILGDRLDDG